jgi:hypothetical protein
MISGLFGTRPQASVVVDSELEYITWSTSPSTGSVFRQVASDPDLTNKKQQFSSRRVNNSIRSALFEFCLSNKIVSQPTAGVKI